TATAWATAERAALRRPTRRCSAGVERDHARHLNAFASLANLAVNGCSLRRILQPGIFQCRDMQEDVRRTISGRDEAKSLFRVEPFDATPQLGAALILIGHVQLSVEDPYASDTASPAHRKRLAPSCYATMSVWPFSNKKQARKG